MGNTATVPTYVTGTFLASGATQAITYFSPNGDYGLIGAASVYNITAIPEPSTYALCVGLALLGFAALRRRR